MVLHRGLFLVEEVRPLIRSSVGNRTKESLVEDFINLLTKNANVIKYL
jgi:hypothetical protein